MKLIPGPEQLRLFVIVPGDREVRWFRESGSLQISIRERAHLGE
jgi:hypothetical protein